MSNECKGEAVKLLASLWSNTSQTWNHDQQMVAAGVNGLFQKTTTVSEGVLIAHINQLVAQHPGSFCPDKDEETPRDSRSVLSSRF